MMLVTFLIDKWSLFEKPKIGVLKVIHLRCLTPKFAWSNKFLSFFFLKKNPSILGTY